MISFFYFCEKVFILMHIWMIRKKFSKISLPEKDDFYSHLNIEDITDTDYAHTKRVCKDLEIKI